MIYRLDLAPMTRETLAKRFGATIRDEVPEVTWECIPRPMLKLLLEITEAERTLGPVEQRGLAGQGR
jgi:hypothetical protein